MAFPGSQPGQPPERNGAKISLRQATEDRQLSRGRLSKVDYSIVDTQKKHYSVRSAGEAISSLFLAGGLFNLVFSLVVVVESRESRV